MRAAHLRWKLEAGSWELQYQPGKDLVADLGTKVLAPTRMQNLMRMILGMILMKVLQRCHQRWNEVAGEPMVRVMRTGGTPTGVAEEGTTARWSPTTSSTTSGEEEVLLRQVVVGVPTTSRTAAAAAAAAASSSEGRTTSTWRLTKAL